MDSLLTLIPGSARRALLSLLLLAALATAAQAQGRMLPVDTTITSSHEVTIKGQRVPYTATVGTQPVYGEDGKLQNPGFLDYRVPVASDLPMIDTVIVEVPNPGHPYGVRGVGESSIVPPLAAVGNALAGATGLRLTHVPMSPPRVLAALTEAQNGAKNGAQNGTGD